MSLSLSRSLSLALGSSWKCPSLQGSGRMAPSLWFSGFGVLGFVRLRPQGFLALEGFTVPGLFRSKRSLALGDPIGLRAWGLGY